MTDTLIILVSALAAALSFMAFALPMLNKTERKERYQSVIQKRRRDLFEQTKRDLDKKGTASMTAQESMATFFKAEQMLHVQVRRYVGRNEDVYYDGRGFCRLQAAGLGNQKPDSEAYRRSELEIS